MRNSTGKLRELIASLYLNNTQNHQHLEIQRSTFATASGQKSRRNWLARESVRTCVYEPRTKTNARGEEGWIVAFIIIWKGATIRGRVGPFLQILDERERERQKRFRHCTFLQSAAPGYSGCTPLPFSHFSLPPTPPSPPPLPLPPPPGSAAPFSGSNIDPDIFPSFFFPRPYERHFQQFFLSVGHPLSPPPNPTAASHVRTTLVPPPERSYISRSSVRASFIGHQRG